ncbi:uncharacterized protein EI90DRAFT_3047204 [Cantharellus anzutake]|uniref:uncharacterized protein n=1 Tax=Cantharellus anzutake TaxID=1750568 RepID=UPI001908F44F|nr:uncharacterized protein EI90DRAFT_3047204 [Cantharellus anzutake]KAF8335812.1 hypothetical protein EI90DRAFT_3047204 [Cantharellus anzutake]
MWVNLHFQRLRDGPPPLLQIQRFLSLASYFCNRNFWIKKISPAGKREMNPDAQVTMFSKRILTLLLFLVSLSLLTWSKPIDSDEVGIRAIDDEVGVRAIDDVAEVEDLIRRDAFPHRPCGCDQDLLKVLVDLDRKLTVKIQDLDGKKRLGPIIEEIIVIIRVAIRVIDEIRISSCKVTAVIRVCVDIIIKIIVAISRGCHRYRDVKHSRFIVKLDLVIVALLKSCIRVCPRIREPLKVALIVHIKILEIFVNLRAFLGHH